MVPNRSVQKSGGKGEFWVRTRTEGCMHDQVRQKKGKGGAF